MNYQCFMAPNLDDITIDEAKEWVRLFERLAKYADLKHIAMHFRSSGDIPAALKVEAKCQEIYDELPTELRW